MIQWTGVNTETNSDTFGNSVAVNRTAHSLSREEWREITSLPSHTDQTNMLTEVNRTGCGTVSRLNIANILMSETADNWKTSKSAERCDSSMT